MTAPQIIEALSDLDYHSSPALSYSTGKEYLRSPAHYLWAREHRTERATFDFGHIVHTGILGTGMAAVEIPESALSATGGTNTKAAKAFISEAREAGKVPMKADDIERARNTVAAVRDHADAMRYLGLPGRAEVPLMATDPVTGVELRGRLDYLTNPMQSGRVIPVDVKTCDDASPAGIRRAIVNFHYDLQGAVYRRLIRLALDQRPAPMVFIFAETKPPHGVNVVQLSHEAWITGGQWKLRTILDLHAQCLAANEWPAYPAGTHAIEPPGWYLRQLDIDDTELEPEE